MTVNERNLKREVAEVVADIDLSDEQLIQRFCNIIGPGMDVSRCCYSKLNGISYLTEIEWVAEEVKPSKGENVLARILDVLVKDGIQELNKETANSILPDSLRVLGRPVLSVLEVTQHLSAIITSPIIIDEKRVAIISLDICTERAHLSNWSRDKLDFAKQLITMLEDELIRRAGV